jgi:hypothetical protein
MIIECICWYFIHQVIILTSTNKLSTGNHEDHGTVEEKWYVTMKKEIGGY